MAGGAPDSQQLLPKTSSLERLDSAMGMHGTLKMVLGIMCVFGVALAIGAVAH